MTRRTTCAMCWFFFFFFQAEDGIRDYKVTGVQTCALPISPRELRPGARCHVDDPDLALDVAPGVDRDAFPVGTPGRMAVIRVAARQLAEVPTIGVHDVDVVRAVAVGLERDALPVGAPHRPQVRRAR